MKKLITFITLAALLQVSLVAQNYSRNHYQSKSYVRELKLQNQSLLDEIQNLRRLVDISKVDIDTLQEQNQTLKREVRQLKKENRRALQTQVSLKKSCEQVNAQNYQMKERVNYLKNEVQQCKTQRFSAPRRFVEKKYTVLFSGFNGYRATRKLNKTLAHLSHPQDFQIEKRSSYRGNHSVKVKLTLKRNQEPKLAETLLSTFEQQGIHVHLSELKNNTIKVERTNHRYVAIK